MRLGEIENPNLAPGMAYWISPRGEILDINGQIHIQPVIERPEKFGLTTERIEQIYADAGQPIGTEGSARGEIILSLIKKGWIRVRLYRKKYFWSINVSSLTNRTYNNIVSWAQYHVNRTDIGKQAGNFGDVRLSSGVTMDTIETREIGQLNEIAKGNLRESIIIDDGQELNGPLRVVESLDDMIGEASISRAFTHLNNKDIAVGIMSGFIGNPKDSVINREKNLERNMRLAHDIHMSKHFGYFYIEGGWVEKRGGEKFFVDEESIFITSRDAGNDNGLLKGFMRKMITKYEQNAGLIKPEGTDHIFILEGDGTMIDLGTFTMGRAEEGYSRIRGKEFHFSDKGIPDNKGSFNDMSGKFQFESERDPAFGNWISRLAAYKKRTNKP